MFDIEQVEVLRGPQATRFGASALAGAIALRSKQPSPYFESDATLSLGTDGLFSLGAAASGPVSADSPQLLYRLSAFQHRSNGFRDNVFLGRQDTNQRDEVSARASIRAQFDAASMVDLSVYGFDFDNGYDAFAIDNSLKTQSDRPGIDSQGTAATALTAQFLLSEEVVLRSVTTGLTSSLDYSYDGDWGNNPFWSPFDPYDFFSATDRARRIFSQELRVMSKNSESGSQAHRLKPRWTAGIYGQRLTEDTEIRNSADGEIYDFYASDYTGTTTAVFGEYLQPLSGPFAVRIGTRLEQRDTTYSDSRGFNQGPDDVMWGGSVSLEYHHPGEALSYLTLSRGFKGSGVNVSVGVPEGNETFAPETLYGLEIGHKQTFLDGNLWWNSAVFGMLRHDIQTELSFQSDPTDPLTFIYLTDNASRGRNLGIETELTYRPHHSTMLSLSGSLLHTEFTSVDEPEPFLEGRAQAHAPEWQYSARLRQYLNHHVFIETNVAGKAAFYYQDSHNARSSPYHLVGAALGFEGPDWSISLWGRNLFDEEYAVRGFFFGNEPPEFAPTEYIQRGDPLQVGTTLFIRF
jgi:outer membrane receptor protein involved in Fe transport